MNFNFLKNILFLLAIVQFASCGKESANLQFNAELRKDIKRNQISENFWANRLQDWQLNKGRIECINTSLPLRTLHLLPYTISSDSGTVKISMKIGSIKKNDSLTKHDYAGLILGAGALTDDFRKRAFIHQTHTKSGGIIAAVNGMGKLIFIDNETGEFLNLAAAEEIKTPIFSTQGLYMQIKLYPEGETYSLNFSIVKETEEEVLSHAKVMNIPKEKIEGNIAFVVNSPQNNCKSGIWFQDFKLSGTKLNYNENSKISPIIGAFYNYFNKQVHLKAQLMPPGFNSDNKVRLEISEYEKDEWKQIAEQEIDSVSYTADFSFKLKKHNTIYNYRLIYSEKDDKGKTKEFFYEGLIKNKQKNTLKLTVIKNTSRMLPTTSWVTKPNNKNRFSLPDSTLSEMLINDKSDFYMFQGELIDKSGFIENSGSKLLQNLKLNYLYELYKWHLSFSEITKNHSCLLLLKDDFLENRNNENEFNLNLSETEYLKKLICKTQHSPEIECSSQNQLLSSFSIGGVNFAYIPEAKREKSDSLLLVNRYLNKPDSFMLSRKRELKKWALNWDNSELKAIITSEPISSLETLNSRKTNIKYNKNKDIIDYAQKTFSVIISSSDTSSFFKYGIKKYADASYSYIAPASISSLVMKKQNNEFISQELNRINLLAKAEKNTKKDVLNSFSYGLISFNKFQQSISFYNKKIVLTEEEQLKDTNNWSIKILAKSNYNKSSPAYLPLLRIKGALSKPVITIFDSRTKELIYTKRINKLSYKPKVFYWGRYDIEILDTNTGRKKIITNILAENINKNTSIKVKF